MLASGQIDYYTALIMNTVSGREQLLGQIIDMAEGVGVITPDNIAAGQPLGSYTNLYGAIHLVSQAASFREVVIDGSSVTPDRADRPLVGSYLFGTKREDGEICLDRLHCHIVPDTSIPTPLSVLSSNVLADIVTFGNTGRTLPVEDAQYALNTFIDSLDPANDTPLLLAGIEHRQRASSNLNYSLTYTVLSLHYGLHSVVSRLREMHGVDADNPNEPIPLVPASVRSLMRSNDRTHRREAAVRMAFSATASGYTNRFTAGRTALRQASYN